VVVVSQAGSQAAPTTAPCVTRRGLDGGREHCEYGQYDEDDKRTTGVDDTLTEAVF